MFTYIKEMGMLPNMIPFRQFIFKLLIWINFTLQNTKLNFILKGWNKSVHPHKTFSNLSAFPLGSVYMNLQYHSLEIVSHSTVLSTGKPRFGDLRQTKHAACAPHSSDTTRTSACCM